MRPVLFWGSILMGVNMSAKELRTKYTREFARMSRYTTAMAWAIVAGYLLQIAIGVGLGGYLLSLPLTWLTVLGSVAVMVFIGTRFRGLNNIIHECSHGTFSDTRSVDWSVGKFCAVVLFSSFNDYRDEHLTHHAHLGDYDHDLDLQGIKDLNLHDPLSPKVVLRHMITPLIGRHLPYYLHLNFSAGDGRGYFAAKIVWLIAILVGSVIFPLTVGIFLALSFVIAYSSLNYWADCLDHAGIVGTQDDIAASRNILAPLPLRVLFFPRNDCFHLVHHLFPHVPARHLETSHRILVQDELYSTRPNAVPARELKSKQVTASVVPAE